MELAREVHQARDVADGGTVHEPQPDQEPIPVREGGKCAVQRGSGLVPKEPSVGRRRTLILDSSQFNLLTQERLESLPSLTLPQAVG